MDGRKAENTLQDVIKFVSVGPAVVIGGTKQESRSETAEKASEVTEERQKEREGRERPEYLAIKGR